MTTPVPPNECNDMASLRQAIDLVDQALVDLLTSRAAYIDRAIELKQQNGWPARIPDRVEDVVAKVVAGATEKGLDPELVERLWRQLIDWSIAREAQVIREED